MTWSEVCLGALRFRCCHDSIFVAEERKRQYEAMRRLIIKEANPALTAKFSLCSDADRLLALADLNLGVHLRPRFKMLKAWIQNPDLGEMEIEQKYHQWVETLRTDRYVTVPCRAMPMPLHH